VCKHYFTGYCPIHILTFAACNVYPEDIAAEVEQPELLDLIGAFIYNQQHSDDVSNASISDLPMFYMSIAFDLIPLEVLKNIALYAIKNNPLGLPCELAPLLLVNRRLHATLWGASNPHLHSPIFSHKFDTAALIRRQEKTE
jgi:hypothetical protein